MSMPGTVDAEDEVVDAEAVEDSHDHAESHNTTEDEEEEPKDALNAMVDGIQSRPTLVVADVEDEAVDSEAVETKEEAASEEGKEEGEEEGEEESGTKPSDAAESTTVSTEVSTEESEIYDEYLGSMSMSMPGTVDSTEESEIYDEYLGLAGGYSMSMSMPGTVDKVVDAEAAEDSHDHADSHNATEAGEEDDNGFFKFLTCEYTGDDIQANCPSGSFCKLKTGECFTKKAFWQGTCARIPQVCALNLSMVCGCNEQTYANECAAHGNTQNVASDSTSVCVELKYGVWLQRADV